MKNRFGRLKGVTSLIMGIVTLLLGVILIINPELTLTGLCSVVGAVLVICGVILMIMYFARAEYRNHQSSDFIVTACMILAGILLLIRKEDISRIFPQFVAIYLMFSGVLKLQGAMDLVGMKEESWLGHLIAGLIIIVAGGIVLIIPDAAWFQSKDIVPVYLCILLAVDGAASIVTLIHVTARRNRYRKLHPEEFVEVIEEHAQEQKNAE